ncbi:MAG: ATP-binding protein, partial [Ktedonobacteraceae bacterium]|nr:ATP-binding protein [Ktedonobacteraceae bacterium]
MLAIENKDRVREEVNLSKTDVMNLINACQSFPRLLEPQIERENILEAIDMTFAGEAQVLIIEGPEGIGKTTLLAQFAKKHPNNAISLFIKPTSHWAYDPELLKYDLCNQMHWALHHEELRPLETITNDRLREYIVALRLKARWGEFYFIVDGLHEIPEENEQLREIILDMLPWGLPGFRFLFSGDAKQFSSQRMHLIISKISQLPPFSTEETKRYMADLEIEKQYVEKVHKAHRGVPSKLSSVRRILISESQRPLEAQKILEEASGVFNNPYQIEWQNVKTNNQQQVILLAIVAHDLKEHTSTDLSRIMLTTEDTILKLIQDLNFIFIDPHNAEISFVSEEFRKFAAIQLRHLKETVNDLLIQDLLRDPEGDDALAYLPEYLQQAGKAKELIEYLSPDRFSKIVEKAQSLGTVRKKAALGVFAALKMKNDNDLLRFTLQESLISDFDEAGVWRSEIEARMAVGDHKTA